MGQANRTVFYVLVYSATEGMGLYSYLRDRDCDVRIAPAPRGETACCGMALRITPENMPSVHAALDDESAPSYDRVVELIDDIDPSRDVYC